MGRISCIKTAQSVLCFVKKVEDLKMKLEDVKQKVDNYLDNVSAEQLLQTLTGKYGMSEYDMNEKDSIHDERITGNAMIA